MEKTEVEGGLGMGHATVDGCRTTEDKQRKDKDKMTTTTYKGYKILTVGISQYIYRPSSDSRFGDGITQSMPAAKRWINEDIKQRALENNRYYA